MRYEHENVDLWLVRDLYSYSPDPAENTLHVPPCLGCRAPLPFPLRPPWFCSCLATRTALRTRQHLDNQLLEGAVIRYRAVIRCRTACSEALRRPGPTSTYKYCMSLIFCVCAHFRGMWRQVACREQRLLRRRSPRCLSAGGSGLSC